MDEQLSKFEGSDIIKWAKDLKHNEKTAKKYEGVATVKDILKVAREDGYNFTEKELLDFNLDLVAGGGSGGGAGSIGSGNSVTVGVGDSQKSETTKHNQNENKLGLDAKVKGNNNVFNVSNGNTANQS